MFGSQIKPQQNQYFTVHGVASAAEKSTTPMFFNHWLSSQHRCIDAVAFDPIQRFIGPTMNVTDLSRPICRPHWNRIGNDWFYSSVSFINVVEIIPCQDSTLPHKPYTGAVFVHEDGHRTCVGSFRADRACAPLKLEKSSQSLYIQITNGSPGDYVAGIQVDEPQPSDKECGWRILKSGGSMTWWFRHAEVYVLMK